MRAWFLNLGPSTTTPQEAASDIRAMLRTEPALVMGCESLDKGPLPNAPGYTKIRDTSLPGRANIFAYVKDAPDLKWDWVDCHLKFPRAEHPELGPHWPRSILRFPLHGEQVIVAHKPPLWKGAGPARWEHDQKLSRMMNPDRNRQRSRMLFWDCNGMEGAQALARRVDGWVVGEHIDNAVVRKVQVVEKGYRPGVDGHHFATDHPWGAFYLRFKFTN